MTMYMAEGAYHHPEGRITNADLAEMVDTTDEWIQKHTGISERRRADDGQDTSDLAVIATRAALSRAGWEPNDIDLLVCATSTPDSLTPATASYIAGELAMRALAFDVNASCSGFIYGLAVSDGLMLTQGHTRVALCTAEKYTKVTDYGDRSSCIFFGDSAATVLLQSERPARGAEVVDVRMRNINEGAHLVGTPVGGHLAMDGPGLKRIALPALVDSARDMLAAHDLGVGDLRAFMGHQVNYRLLEAVTETLGISEEQHWYNVRDKGNQGAAGVVTTLLGGIEKHRSTLRDGDLFLLTVVGAGFTNGSVLLRWIDSAA